MSEPTNPKIWKAKGLVMGGLFTLFILIGGIGTWSVMARIAGAIVASGLMEVDSNRQVVQHPEGGVIGEILVDDGDAVNAGDVLLRLDNTLLQSELAIVEGQLFEHMARRARLVAERDELNDISYNDELLDIAKTDPEVKDLLDGQMRLFSARKVTLEGEASQLHERKQQVVEQITGTEAQILAVKQQLELAQSELQSQQALLDQGLAQTSQVSALQREEASLSGRIGELVATMAQARGQIAEIEIEILRLTSATREEAITTLRDLQYSEVELRERRLGLRERMSRLDIRAPRAGVVYGLQVHTIRSVISQAEPLLYIVPQDTSLVTTARINSADIDQVDLGQAVTLRFSAFDMRTTPEIKGSVTKISADIFTDEATGASFYVIEMLPNEGEVAKLDGRTLLPGMPVEVFIRTGDRSPLEYLVKPLSGYFNRAFREN